MIQPDPPRIFITGGTGFIGQALIPRLVDMGCKLTILSRRARTGPLPEWPVFWVQSIDQIPLDQKYDAIINLAGESLAEGRWTDSKKQRLWDSRIGLTSKLFDRFSRADRPVSLVLSASAVGYYGPHGDEQLDEDGSTNDSFSQKLCAAWEEQAQRFSGLGSRVLNLRFGVVLDRSGGAFEDISRPLLAKSSAQFGSGEAYFSWIHRDDLIGVITYLLTQAHAAELSGAVNCTAPDAVTYAELAAQLKIVGKAWFKVRIPATALRMVFGQMADELLLTGQNVYPKKLLDLGFRFRYPKLEDALHSLLK